VTTEISDKNLWVVTPNTSVKKRLYNIWQRRDLLRLLIAKELSVRYKNSVLGFAWSMVNPALMLLVYYFVFQIVLKSGIQSFAIFLMSGLLVWNLFTSCIQGSTTVIISNSGIVKKVAFPRELLVLAKLGESTVFFLLQALVLAIVMAILLRAPDFGSLWLLPLGFLGLIIFCAALGTMLSALNVFFRDIQHFVEIALFAWFFATPIVYSYSATIGPELAGTKASHFLQSLHLGFIHLTWVYLADPVVPVILSFQRAIYGMGSVINSSKRPVVPVHSIGWYAGLDLWVIAVGLVLFYFALKIFSRVESNFAEEL
jgi:ABC-2 type transport system permease protein